MDNLLTDPLLTVAPEVDGEKQLQPVALKAKIGSGGMGAVYRGRHLNLDIDVAVKILDPILAAQGTDFVERFKREAQLAATIVHPNLVRVFDVLEFAGLHYLVMEYVHGESAMERVARVGPVPLEEAARIVELASRGLAAAHERGVVHRDIKPDNILLAKTGEVKVADLGLAKALDSADTGLTQSQARMGTPRYMAPEQWEDSKSVGPAADVWSLGATFYYLLAGKHAIEHGSVPEIVRQVCIESFPDVRQQQPQLSDAAAELIERCTQLDPAARYADAAEVGRALQALLATADAGDVSAAGPDGPDDTVVDGGVPSGFTLPPTTPPSPQRTPLPQRPRKPGRKHMLIGAAGLFLLVVLILIVRGGGDEETPELRGVDPATTPAYMGRARSEAELSAAVWRDWPDGVAAPDEVTDARQAFELAEALRQAGKDADAAKAFAEAHDRNLAAKVALDEMNSGQQESAVRALGSAKTLRGVFDTALELIGTRLRDAKDEHEKRSLGDLRIYLETDVMRGEGFRKVDARLRQGEALFEAGQYGPARLLLERVTGELQGYLENFRGREQDEQRQREESRKADDLARAKKSAARNREAAYNARDTWKAYADAESVAESRKAKEAARAYERGELARRAGDYATAAHAYAEAENAYREAVESGRAWAAARGLANKAGADARQAQARFHAEEPGAEASEAKAAMERASDALKAEDYAAARAAYAEATKRYNAARVSTLAKNKLRDEAVAARKDALDAQSQWSRAPKGPGARKAPEIPKALKAWRRAEAEENGGDFEAAAKSYANAAAQYRRAMKKYRSTGVPPGFKALDGKSRVQDPRSGIVFIRVERPGGTPYYLAETEVTVTQWIRFARARNYGHQPGGETGDHPQGDLSWDDAQAFCRHYGYRLPSEQEWRHACRAGTAGNRYGSLDSIAWYSGNTGKEVAFGIRHSRKSRPVGRKKANRWGFKDMLGNLWEWCQDGGRKKWLRGGSYSDGEKWAVADGRKDERRSDRKPAYGFRPAKTP